MAEFQTPGTTQCSLCQQVVSNDDIQAHYEKEHPKDNIYGKFTTLLSIVI